MSFLNQERPQSLQLHHLRIFKKMLEDKYGQEEAAKRIYATTDKARGALKDLAN